MLNRDVGRLTLFEEPEDYEAFVRVLEEVSEEIPLPIVTLVAMPNHWHTPAAFSSVSIWSRF